MEEYWWLVVGILAFVGGTTLRLMMPMTALVCIGNAILIAAILVLSNNPPSELVPGLAVMALGLSTGHATGGWYMLRREESRDYKAEE